MKEDYKSDNAIKNNEDDIENQSNMTYAVRRWSGERGMSTSPSMQNSGEHHVVDIDSYLSVPIASVNDSSPNCKTSSRNVCNHNDSSVYTGYRMRPADPKLYGEYRNAAEVPKYSKDFGTIVDPPSSNLTNIKDINPHNVRQNGVAVGKQGRIDFNQFTNTEE
jgi:hypothetical protein